MLIYPFLVFCKISLETCLSIEQKKKFFFSARLVDGFFYETASFLCLKNRFVTSQLILNCMYQKVFRKSRYDICEL